jgi:hypothetical protein
VGAGREEMSEVSLAERQEVVRTIEAAWADAQYPGDNKIAVYSEIDFDEVIKIKRDFTGKQWKEVSHEILVIDWDCLPFFTVEGLRFYLPAYMIASLLHHESVNMLTHSILQTLSPPDPKGMRENFKRYSNFPLTDDISDTFQQLANKFDEFADGFKSSTNAAISAFLEICAKVDDPIIFNPNVSRLLEYWKQRG